MGRGVAVSASCRRPDARGLPGWLVAGQGPRARAGVRVTAPGYGIQTGYNHVLCLSGSHGMKTRAPAVRLLKCVIV